MLERGSFLADDHHHSRRSDDDDDDNDALQKNVEETKTTFVKDQILSSLTSFVRIPSVLREKRPRGIVPSARFKNIEFISRPSVHVCRFHLRDVHA
jgi:hypothetical protein